MAFINLKLACKGATHLTPAMQMQKMYTPKKVVLFFYFFMSLHCLEQGCQTQFLEGHSPA